MFSKIGIINIMLALALIFFGFKIYGVWKKGEVAVIGNQKTGKAAPHSQKRVAGRKNLPESYYKTVAKRDLFSPDRTEFVPDVSESEVESERQKMPGKKITLYGVVMIDDDITALVSNPEKKSGEKPSKWVRTGDRLGDVTVVSIEKDSILLSDGTKNYRISLYDHIKSQIRPAATITEQPTVITIKKEPKPEKPEKPKNEKISNEQHETISTPFGNIKRRKE
jgi:hypothetical protein